MKISKIDENSECHVPGRLDLISQIGIEHFEAEVKFIKRTNTVLCDGSRKDMKNFLRTIRRTTTTGGFDEKLDKKINKALKSRKKSYVRNVTLLSCWDIVTRLYIQKWNKVKKKS